APRGRGEGARGGAGGRTPGLARVRGLARGRRPMGQVVPGIVGDPSARRGPRRRTRGRVPRRDGRPPSAHPCVSHAASAPAGGFEVRAGRAGHSLPELLVALFLGGVVLGALAISLSGTERLARWYGHRI